MYNFTSFPQMNIFLILKSTVVTFVFFCVENYSSQVKDVNKAVFPTLESPTNIILNFAQSFLEIYLQFLEVIILNDQISFPVYTINFIIQRNFQLIIIISIINKFYYNQHSIQMDQKSIQHELKNSRIREGPLYKRSKFLKDWRERWVVITMNYIFTFTNKTCKQVTDVIDLKQIKSYKSYVRKDEQMIPSGFKIRSQQNQFYFSARNPNQKWSWLVTIQRLMDYKYVGSTTYNNIDYVKTKGFQSQIQFQNGGKLQKVANLDQFKQTNVKKTAQEAKKEVDGQAQKILKQLQDQQLQLKKKQQQVQKKEKQLHQQQAQFLLEKNKKEQLSKTQKTEQKKVVSQTNSSMGSKVSQLKNIFQKKMEETSKQTTPNYKYQGKNQDLKVRTINKNQSLHSFRAKTVANLFQQFHNEGAEPQGLKFIIDFLVKIASDSKYGYNSSIVIEAKTHNNRKTFAQIFVELITDYTDFQNCYLLARFIQICVFEIPGLFNSNQSSIIQGKLSDFFFAINDQAKLEVILKNMFIMHKMSKYAKNDDMKNKLNKLIKQCKRQETRNWARKLFDDLN